MGRQAYGKICWVGVDRLGGADQRGETDWLAKVKDDLDSRPRHQSRHG
jgi:hypothetical protein